MCSVRMPRSLALWLWLVHYDMWMIWRMFLDGKKTAESRYQSADGMKKYINHYLVFFFPEVLVLMSFQVKLIYFETN